MVRAAQVMQGQGQLIVLQVQLGHFWQPTHKPRGGHGATAWATTQSGKGLGWYFLSSHTLHDDREAERHAND